MGQDLVNGLGVCSVMLVGGRGFWPSLLGKRIHCILCFFLYELRLLGEPKSLEYLDNCQFLQSYSSF